jgi:hypothetical protein
VKRFGLALVLVLAATLAGCKKDAPTPAPSTTASPSAAVSTSASPSPGASAAPSASADNGLVEFTVDGAGPYQLGATLASLTADLDEVKTGAAPCPDNTTARGKGVWQDLQLRFHKDGTLYLAVNRSPNIPTPSGAWLGFSLAQLKAIYSKVPTEDLTHMSDSAYLVTTTSGRGVLFELNAAKKVTAMYAGEAPFLKSSYIGGTGFC